MPSKNRGFRSVSIRTTFPHVKSGKSVLGEMAVLDQLPRLGEHPAHVGHVPVADVGREHRVQPDAVGEQRAVERERVHRVVGLAAEAELAGEDVDDVVGAGDPRLGEVVDAVARLAGVAATAWRPPRPRSW